MGHAAYVLEDVWCGSCRVPLTLTCCPRCSPSERQHEECKIIGGSDAA
jgi:hypothetical protein